MDKLTPKEDLYLWVVENLDEPLNDILFKIACLIGKRNNWDVDEVYEMVDEMVEEVKEGILNVIEMYES